MAVPVTNAVAKDRYRTLKLRAAGYRTNLLAKIASMAVDGAGYTDVGAVYGSSKALRDEIVVAKDVPNIIVAAQSIEENPSLDIQVEWNALLAALNGLLVWIENPSNVPLNNKDVAPVQSWAVADQPEITDRWNGAQTAGIRAVMQTVADQMS